MKIICIGRNYVNHAKELGNTIPTEPLFFLKPETAIQPKGHPFFSPDFSNDIPYELEFTCDFPRFGRLLAELSASERIIKIDEFKFINTPDQIRRSSGLNKQLPGAKITMVVSTLTLNK